MNGFDLIIQLISVLMVVIGFVFIIEMIAGIIYTKEYLNDLEGCKRDLEELDKEQGVIVERDNDKVIEAIKLTRRDCIIKGMFGVMLLVGGFVALFM